MDHQAETEIFRNPQLIGMPATGIIEIDENHHNTKYFNTNDQYKSFRLERNDLVHIGLLVRQLEIKFQVRKNRESVSVTPDSSTDFRKTTTNNQ